MNQRVDNLDWLKGLCICFVVFCHVKWVDGVGNWMSSFKLSAFFIVTGLLLSKKDIVQLSFREFVWRRIKSIMVPYFVFWFLWVLYVILFKDGLHLNWFKAFLVPILSLTGPSSLWFLPVLFLGEIILVRVAKWGKAVLGGLILAGVLASCGLAVVFDVYDQFKYIRLLTFLPKTIVAFVFLGIGYLIEPIRFIVGRRRKFLVGGILTGLNILMLAYFNGQFGVNYMLIHPFLVYLCCGVCGSYGALYLFESVEGLMDFKTLRWCGRNSLIIMATHLPLGIVALSNCIVRRMSLNYDIISGGGGICFSYDN